MLVTSLAACHIVCWWALLTLTESDNIHHFDISFIEHSLHQPLLHIFVTTPYDNPYVLRLRPLTPN